ncbi:hypothetical protein AB3480_30725 [Rhizobium mongolense]|uniref:hypothetical protein n=1 Tax=Rhizobium mongolense TaxID=57676 RepID=UPI0034A37952
MMRSGLRLVFGKTPLAALALALTTGQAPAATITIVTQATDGRPLNAVLEKRVAGQWEPVQGTQAAIGRFETSEATCDTSILFRASDDSGVYSRDIKVTKTCSTPEVVFNDFVPGVWVVWQSGSRLQDSSYWTKVLGDSGGNAIGPNAAGAFTAAIKNNEYGQVAVMANEFSAQLKQAGNTSAADYMAAIALDATTRGVLLKQGEQVDAINSLVVGESGKLVLSSDARKKIVDYQVQDLGRNPKSNSLGKVDWQTIRSIDGAKAKSANDWKLPKGVIESFSVSPF